MYLRRSMLNPVADVSRADLGNVIVPPFSLLFLQFEGNTTDRTTSDMLHKVGREASDLVTRTF